MKARLRQVDGMIQSEVQCQPDARSFVSGRLSFYE